jgi:hypothetical protein
MKISDTALQGTTDYSIIALEGQDWRSANPYNGDTFGVIVVLHLIRASSVLC